MRTFGVRFRRGRVACWEKTDLMVVSKYKNMKITYNT